MHGSLSLFRVCRLGVENDGFQVEDWHVVRRIPGRSREVGHVQRRFANSEPHGGGARMSFIPNDLRLYRE